LAEKQRRAPDHLKARGRNFWARTLADFDLDDGEMELLAEVCRTLDGLDALAAAVERDGVTVSGSTGQTQVHPAITEARGQRAILHRLLKALDLPTDEAAAVTAPAVSLKASRAASSRWRAHNSAKAVNGG
jgi:phage terminase small subunit